MSDAIALYQNAIAKAKAAQEEVEARKSEALTAFRKRREELLDQVSKLDSEIAALSGETVSNGRTPRKQPTAKKQISLRLLVDKLKDLPEQTMSIRKEGYDTTQIRQLALDNPGVISLGGNGPWPTVSLIGK